MRLFWTIWFGRRLVLLGIWLVSRLHCRLGAQKCDCRKRELLKRCKCLVVQITLADLEVQCLQCIEHCHARVRWRELLANELRVER